MNKVVLSLFVAFSFLANGQEQKETINWMTIEEAEEAAKKEPRKVIIDVYTHWCGWCKKMDASTFQNPGLAKYVNQHFYAVKMNGEEKDSITFKGHKFGFVPNGKRGYNELPAVMMNGRMSYPTIIYLDEELNVIQPVPGYQNPKSFEQIITYLAEDHHKTQPFEQYKQNYKVSISKLE